MKSFATSEKRSAPAVIAPHTPALHSMGSMQPSRRAEIRHILHGVGVQAKLAVGQADDPYELEADRVANSVMRMPAATPQSRSTLEGGAVPVPPKLKQGKVGRIQRKAGDIPAPASAPSLTPVAEIFSEEACGHYQRGVTTEAESQQMADCGHHARFVNYFAQGAENIGKVSSPYAPGIAALLKGFIPLITAAGKDAYPTEGHSKSYKVNHPTIEVSPGVTVAVGELTLTLVNDLNGPNGAYGVDGLELNEASRALLFKDPTDLERTLYHECFHYISGLVSTHNQGVRQKTIAGPEVLKGLDRTFIANYKGQFQKAAKPVWKRIQKELTVHNPLPEDRPVTTDLLLDMHWIKVVNEILSRVEEAVYLRLRQGLGFNRADLEALQQEWLYTADYWDSGVIYLKFHLNTFLRENKALVDAELLPAVQKIQLEYLKVRPSSQ